MLVIRTDFCRAYHSNTEMLMKLQTDFNICSQQVSVLVIRTSFHLVCYLGIGMLKTLQTNFLKSVGLIFMFLWT